VGKLAQTAIEFPPMQKGSELQSGSRQGADREGDAVARWQVEYAGDGRPSPGRPSDKPSCSKLGDAKSSHFRCWHIAPISLLCSKLWRFRSEADIASRTRSRWARLRSRPSHDVFGKRPARSAISTSPRCVIRQWIVPNSPGGFANDHPEHRRHPLPERGDILLAERIHAGAVSFSLRKSRAQSARDRRPRHVRAARR